MRKQWFKHGDHHAVTPLSEATDPKGQKMSDDQLKGFHWLNRNTCKHFDVEAHGWLNTEHYYIKRSLVVCPGDFIVGDKHPYFRRASDDTNS